MPRQAQLPDGTILEFPDDTPDDVMDRAVRSHLGQAKPDFSNVISAADTVKAAPPPQAPPKPYWGQRIAEAKALGNGLRFNIAETALGVGQLVGGADQSNVQHFRKLRSEAQAEAAQGSPRGHMFFDGGDVIGSLAQTAAPVGKVATTGKAAYGLAGLMGGLYGATRPVGENESRLKNTGIGTAAGLGGQAGAQGLAALGRLAPQATRDVFNAAQDRGIPLTFAQVSDSDFVKRLAHLSDRLPLSGATARTRDQVKAVNRAVAGEVGARLNSDGVIDAGVMAHRYDLFNRQFDRVFKDGTPLDREFAEKVGQVWKFANDNLDDSAQKTVNSLVRRLEDQADNGRLSGATLQSIDRDLRELATGGGDRERVATQLRNALHDNFGRNAGPDAREAWERLRKQYANYKRIEPLVARNPEGPLPPTQLVGAMTSDKRGKAAMARGAAGGLGDIAAIGRRMKGPQTSGTPEGMQTAAVGYGLAANPASTLALLLSGNTAGRALNSNFLARLMMSDSRGGIAPFAPYARPLPFLLAKPANADEPERP